MKSVSLTEQRARDNFFRENDLFRSGDPLWGSDCWPNIYDQIRSHGVVLEKSVLIHIIPDDVSALSGSIIRQNGNVCEFWLDYEDQSCSEWEEFEVTASSHKPSQHTKDKPWGNGVLARELFTKIMIKG